MDDALSLVLIIDLTCHGQWHTSQVRHQPPCSGSVACLKKAILVLPFALVPLSKLYWHGGKIVLPSPTGHVAHLSTDFYITGSCARIVALRKLPWSRLALNRDCAVKKREAAKLYTSPVRRQPPCSGSFSCLKRHWCHRWSCTSKLPK